MKPTYRRPSLKRVATARPVAPAVSKSTPVAFRSATPVVHELVRRRVVAEAVSNFSGILPDPYVDYARILTTEGGIRIVYKSLDQRLRLILFRVFLWSAATAPEGWFLFSHVPPRNLWLNLTCLAVLGVINWLIVSKRVEAYYSIEIRPDCMILDEAEIFWLEKMDVAWPRFQPDEDGNQIFGGLYGNRFVEFFTVVRLEELDRTPEVLAAHLQDAMRQLWTKPQPF